MKANYLFYAAIGVLSFCIGCANEVGNSETVPEEKISIVERKDTIVSFDPETMEESIQIVTSYDTIISFDSGQSE